MRYKKAKAAIKRAKNYAEVMEYVESILSGAKIACKELKQTCQRFKNDLQNDEYDFNTNDAEFVIQIIEKTCKHVKGESLDGESLKGKPLILQPWQKFIIYNLLGFFKKGTKIRRYKEAFIYIPRKNGKTSFVAALAWALSLLQRRSGSTVYIVAADLKEALQSFNFLNENVKKLDPENIENFRILDNNQEHSIKKDFDDGSIFIQALAANPDTQDSLNCNVGIADEIHAYKTPKQYNIIKEAMKAYTNKLMIGITTAGDNMNSFCYKRVQYCEKVLNGTVKDEQLFIFMTRAPKKENGDVDFTNPVVHEMANPNYGVTIRPEDMLNDSMQALNDPQQRKDFLAKSLNVYTAALKAYFNIDEFRNSDKQFNWTIEELAKMPVKWYGGADLSKLHDLTAGALYGTLEDYECVNAQGIKGKYDVDIIVTHAWFPIVQAARKAEEDGIPLFGWKDDGWLDMCNSPTVNHAEIVNWFKDRRKQGFKIKSVGHDRKFCKEYFVGMKEAGFDIVDQPQYFYKKSQGFRHIEQKAKDGLLYYMHSDAFEYCVQNVSAVEKTDEMIQYDKIRPEQRIDIFDASVFACVRKLEDMENKSKVKKWFKKEAN